MNIPSIIPRKDLRHTWIYRDQEGNPLAFIARYETRLTNGKNKKWYHQFRLSKPETWVEGAPSPLPIFGLETLPKPNCDESVYIFEGEKCAKAAHYLGLSALTSMMGSSQAEHGDWAILAQYRHIKQFVLIPDNDSPGKKYIEVVFNLIRKICPQSEISVCALPVFNQGDDFIDWILAHDACPEEWDGFVPIDEPHCEYLKLALKSYIEKNQNDAKNFFSQEKTSIIFDGEPDPIEEVFSPVLPCPIETFPTSVNQWITILADQMQIPSDYLAAPFLVYVGSLIGRKRALRLRPGTDWIEHANLWGMLIGRPSVMKSPAMKAVRKPLMILASQADEHYAYETKRFEFDSEAWTIRRKANEEVYKKSVKDSIASQYSLSKVEFMVEEPPKEPIRRRYKTDDPTVEKLGELLIENPQGLLLFRDEISGWLRSFEKAGRENDRQFFLEGWSGKEDFDVDRISRGSLHVPALCISIFGSIQPGPITQYIRSALKGGCGDDGFIQRFQITVWPDVKPDWELVKPVPISAFEEQIQGIFRVIDGIAFDADNEPIVLEFTPSAQILFDDWQYQHERRLRSGELPPHLEAHLAKYKKLLPALCLVFAHIDSAKEGALPAEISEKMLLAALEWLRYFESHAVKIYSSGMNTVLKTAVDLLQRIRQGEIKEPFTTRDVYYKRHWSGLSTAEEVEEVLDYLVEKNYLASSFVKTTGRPTTKYWVNPKIFE
jgi:hypothetical protein